MKAACSSDSPPPKHTPPPVARKYRSSIFTRPSSSAAVTFSAGASRSSFSLMHQRQRSGQPAPAISVVTPVPSVPMRRRDRPSSG